MGLAVGVGVSGFFTVCVGVGEGVSVAAGVADLPKEQAVDNNAAIKMTAIVLMCFMATPFER